VNVKPKLARFRVGTTLVAAALSTLIAIGLLTAVTGLFQRFGCAVPDCTSVMSALCLRAQADRKHLQVSLCPEDLLRALAQ
jgi:hypothetical protein